MTQIAAQKAVADELLEPFATGLNPDGTPFHLPVSAVEGAVKTGQFYLSGTGRLTLSVAGNLRVLVSNPAGSGKNVSLAKLAGFSSAMGFGTLFINPTAGLPAAAARPVMNAIVGGGVPASTVITTDTSTTTPLSGGAATGIVLGAPPNNRFELALPPLVLAPGVSLGINVPFAGATDASFSLYWMEAAV